MQILHRLLLFKKSLTNNIKRDIIYKGKGVDGLKVELRKQPEKYLSKCTESEYNKINGALSDLENLKGDIKKLQGRKDEYRVKLPPFRIIFVYDKVSKTITVTKIDTRGDVYKKG